VGAHEGTALNVPVGDDRVLGVVHPGARPEPRPDDGHLSIAIGSNGDILDGVLGLPSLRR
jgi:hypothetical protein